MKTQPTTVTTHRRGGPLCLPWFRLILTGHVGATLVFARFGEKGDFLECDLF